MSFSELTARERVVAIQLALGEDRDAIAEALGIRPSTVNTHRLHVLTKLRCRNTADLARLAIKEGVIKP